MAQSDNNQEMFPIVDEQGNITGTATRGECHSGSKLLHPVVHLHIFNANGDLYLQKRPEWKDIQPGKWDTAVGGHIDDKALMTADKAFPRHFLLYISQFCMNPVNAFIF